MDLITKQFASSLYLVALLLAVGVTSCQQSRDPNAPEAVDDKTLSAQVTEALHADPDYKFPNVQVTSLKGTIQLSGFVNSRDQRSKAGETAGKVPGAKKVINNITVQE